MEGGARFTSIGSNHRIFRIFISTTLRLPFDSAQGTSQGSAQGTSQEVDLFITQGDDKKQKKKRYF